jgi:hypothetical protein
MSQALSEHSAASALLFEQPQSAVAIAGDDVEISIAIEIAQGQWTERQTREPRQHPLSVLEGSSGQR